MNVASIIKKAAMAITGLAWVGFLVSHLTGNLLLIVGADEFNKYAATLASFGPLLWVAEIGLLAFLATHVYSGIRVTLENKNARPRSYAMAQRQRGTLASRTMIVGGTILTIFLILHIYAFKFSDHSAPGGLHGVVAAAFKNPLTVAWYEVAMLALGLHLSHGIGSAFQTLGVSKITWRNRFRTLGMALGWLLAAGFMTLPILGFVGKM